MGLAQGFGNFRTALLNGQFPAQVFNIAYIEIGCFPARQPQYFLSDGVGDIRVAIAVTTHP